MIRTTHTVMSMSRKGGGLQAAVLHLGKALQATGEASVDVLAPADEFSAADQFQWEPVRAEALPVKTPKSFFYCPDMPGRLGSSRPDVVHNHGLWLHPSQATVQWSARERRPYIVSPHGMLEPEWELQKSRLKKKIAGRLFQNRHLRGAGCLHALNRQEAEHIRLFGLNNPICVIPNGVDLPTLSVSEIRQQRGQKAQKTLLYLGRINRKKGLQSLIEAWGVLARELPDLAQWHLKVGGWGQDGHEDELRAQVHATGLTGAVSFVGPLFGPEKEQAFIEADAFVLPSWSEGLPISVIEAWAYALPVLMTTRCNLPEGLETKSAFTVEPGAESLAEGLRQLVACPPGEREAMGGRGRALAEQKFTWPNVARQMLEVYRWLRDGGPKPATIV